MVVDASPEFRLQTAAAGVKRLDALLMTHDHADQAHGIDDIRAFAHAPARAHPVPWMDAATRETLHAAVRLHLPRRGGLSGHRRHRTTFRRTARPGASTGRRAPIPVVTFDQDHGGVRKRRLSLRHRGLFQRRGRPAGAGVRRRWRAWRCGSSTRCATRRIRPTPTSSGRWAGSSGVRPKRAILTNMHIDLDYDELTSRLPPGVEPAYDGLRFDRRDLRG